MRILVVDDDGVCRLAMQAMLVALGHECLLAVDGGEGWRRLQRNDVDVVIADRRMPGLNGVQVCRLIRAELGDRYVQVILATAMREPGQMLDGMNAGADDYLVKPVAVDELRLRLIVAQRVIEVHRKLERLNAELQAVSRHDALTGLGNRRSLDEQLAAVTSSVVRYGHRYSVVLIDVDHFKAFNDTYGHQSGDSALQAVAGVLQSGTRAGDTWYRYGGEEFLGVYPYLTAHEAQVAIDRVLTAVTTLAIPHSASPGRGVLTVSAGIAEMNPNRPDAVEVIRLADAALYRAKQAGRDTVKVAAGPQRAALASASLQLDRSAS